MVDLYKNEVSIDIVVTVTYGGVAQDISSYTTKTLLLQKPSGTIISKPMDFVTDGTDGKLKYVTQTGDINEFGVWKMQAKLENATTVKYTEIESLSVGNVLA